MGKHRYYRSSRVQKELAAAGIVCYAVRSTRPGKALPPGIRKVMVGEIMIGYMFDEVIVPLASPYWAKVRQALMLINACSEKGGFPTRKVADAYKRWSLTMPWIAAYAGYGIFLDRVNEETLPLLIEILKGSN